MNQTTKEIPAAMRLAWLAAWILAAGPLAASDATTVQLLRTPAGGIQPQAVADAQGAVHLIWFKGDPMAGDLYYATRKPGDAGFGEAVRVNRQPGSAIATGTIRGAQLALGKGNRAHVVWNGSGRTAVNGENDKTPLLYTRLDDTGKAFEAERNLITRAWGLDGGSSVAADAEGKVYACWHASQPGNTRGEAGRSVFVARSADDGKTFSPETRAEPEATGACGCCGMKSFADAQGRLFIAYRGAKESVERDIVLLMSANQGGQFRILGRHPWKINACPMSSAFLGGAAGGVLAAWETDGQVYWARLDAGAAGLGKPVAPPGTGKRKHPALAVNRQGQTLLVWTEGTGWNRGGAVAWQLFDRENRPLPEKGRADGVPVWSMATAYATAGDSFVVVY